MTKIILLFLGTLLLPSVSLGQARSFNLGQVPSFTLVNQNEQQFGNAELNGNVWLVSFIFTRCTGPCPLVSKRMSELQKKLPGKIKLLSISVDPEFDSPAILKEYAATFASEPGRWFFLTGKKKRVYELILKGFKVGVEANTEAKNVGESFVHSTRIALVDGDGNIRGYFDGTDPEESPAIIKSAKLLFLETEHPFLLNLPRLNAFLNLGSALLLMAGFVFIKNKKVAQHRFAMVGALVLSFLFLLGYLIYHHYAGSIPFTGGESVRALYFTILISHSILAAVIVPLAGITLYRAWKADYQKHVAIARWTLPIWMYVSVTGVTIYLLLYG